MALRTRDPSRKTGLRKTLLAIDDDPHIADILGLLLKDKGYDVIEASDGRQGLEKARDLKPDIIVLDVMMPELDGWEVLKELKRSETARDIPVVIVSVFDEKKLGFRLGAFDYLVKPFEIPDILGMVEKVESAMKIIPAREDA
jgi:DNA-binding response OmpR family regulator